MNNPMVQASKKRRFSTKDCHSDDFWVMAPHLSSRIILADENVLPLSQKACRPKRDKWKTLLLTGQKLQSQPRFGDKFLRSWVACSQNDSEFKCGLFCPQQRDCCLDKKGERLEEKKTTHDESFCRDTYIHTCCLQWLRSFLCSLALCGRHSLSSQLLF